MSVNSYTLFVLHIYVIIIYTMYTDIYILYSIITSILYTSIQ